jgi:hypothetical protein
MPRGSEGRDFIQKMTCSDMADGAGESVVLKDYAPFFENYQFDNTASSCCVDGMQVFPPFSRHFFPPFLLTQDFPGRRHSRSANFRPLVNC